MSRRAWIALVVVVVGAATALTLYFVRSAPPQASPPPTSSAPAAPTLSEQQAAFLTTELTSGDEKRLRAVVAVADGQQIESAAVAQFATLAPLTFDVSSFQDNGDGTAKVTALRGGSPMWTVYLVLVGEAWKISSTEAL
ncbi:hypothetical protein [Lentzea sp. NEAU-D7]|uniref:hypothetical protein n=1 Tax=Lentzea sp. NEAU-D7 TaxID=2994667 RepID=UPI00224B082F|nr:hypothetical protein [Lentzea sp. NEAU-D7]MCX2950188.1 hypothetical protein [Lentzea sp. NEAU-D7]